MDSKNLRGFMSSPVTDNSGSILASFRQYSRDIRQPRDYQIGVSEFKGILNLIIGTGQLLACPLLYFAPKQYALHKELGKSALKQGIRDLKFMMVFTAVMGTSIYAVRKFTKL